MGRTVLMLLPMFIFGLNLKGEHEIMKMLIGYTILLFLLSTAFYVYSQGFAGGNWSSGDLCEDDGTDTTCTSGDLLITSGDIGLGVTSPNVKLDVDEGTGFGAIRLDGSSGGCIMVRDTDDSGWSKGTLLDGAITWATDADGVC